MKKRIFGLKKQAKEIAMERIEILFKEAEKAFGKSPEKAKRYVELARKISTRTKTKMPKELKRKFCRKCNAYLVPGKNAKIRIKNKALIITCLECKALSKLPFWEREKDKNRRAESL